MFEFLYKKLTKDHAQIPLLFIDFDLNKYNSGEKSCDIRLHPNFRDDELLKQKINDLIDYMRENHDMDKLVK